MIESAGKQIFKYIILNGFKPSEHSVISEIPAYNPLLIGRRKRLNICLFTGNLLPVEIILSKEDLLK